MKKIIFTLCLVCSTIYSNAQLQVQKGDFIFDPYIGFPQTNALRTPQAGQINFRLNGGLLSYGGRGEFMIADNLGIGVDVNYVVSGSNYDEITIDTIQNGVTGEFNYVENSYNWNYRVTKLRAMFRFNYHFVQNDRVDAYFGFAAGYRGITRKFSIEDPNGSPSLLLDQDKALIPVSMRIAIGTRIYINQNIGGMIELGLGGGALIQTGLSIKF